VSKISKELGFPIQAIHIPKTVDNDLPITDCCPGFGSVAKYVAVSMKEASFDVASMAKTSTKVFILEVMGRHAGWIAAAGGLASTKDSPLPLVILFPEITFNRKKFIKKVQEKVKKFGYCSIVVSEGVKGSNGQFLSDQGLKDAFGHAQLGGVAPVIANLIKEDLGFKYHWSVADYLQRAARHIASQVDVDQAYALGASAVKLAIEGQNAVMPTIERISDHPYKWKLGTARLSRVANIEKKMPKKFISIDGFGITPSCERYLKPLIKGEAYPPYKDGLPKYVTLKNKSVKKKLSNNFKI
jgi:6-phosphofructokinase 1